ncbi:MAG: hypothetical protein QM270_03340 [Bacillota bacterium]|nr:hypothetical protein [Bacillota bacterium]
MKRLEAEFLPVAALSDDLIATLYELMEESYLGMDEARFRQDLMAKDGIHLLRGPDGDVEGFSSERRLAVTLPDGSRETGVFSGDTIIRATSRGSTALFRSFALRHVPAAAAADGDYWWFLISKGYKTYRILPTLFRDWYPRRDTATPPRINTIREAYARQLYGDIYDASSGVLRYRDAKDRLRPGIADIDARCLRNPDIAWFQAANPGWVDGDDLVCLASLKPENLRDPERLLG